MVKTRYSLIFRQRMDLEGNCMVILSGGEYIFAKKYLILNG